MRHKDRTLTPSSRGDSKRAGGNAADPGQPIRHSSPVSLGDEYGADPALNLLVRVQSLEAQVGAAARSVVSLWRSRISDREFEGPASNFAAYLALRELDLSDLQRDLAKLGMSSLGRSESHVLPTLQAVRSSLARMTGVDDVAYPPDTAWTEGDDRLARLKASLFAAYGDQPGIMVTLPSEAAEDADLVEQLVRMGMTCARINCAHDSPDVWRGMCGSVRRAAAEQGKECRILMDLPGPKCRIETVTPEKPKRLHVGDCFRLLAAEKPGSTPDNPHITISFPALVTQLKPGLAVWINDGKIRARIVEACEGGWVLEVTSARQKGERLQAGKGRRAPRRRSGPSRSLCPRPGGPRLRLPACRPCRILLRATS
jgi:pyruvate kinase